MPNAPIVNAGNRYVNGLTMTWVDATTIEISSGAARNSANTNDIILSDTVDLDLTLINRVNGLNTGSLEATKAYKVYIIGDSYGYNATGVLAILDQGSIALPLGYDIYAQIGSFTTDGSAEVRKFYQYGKAGSRTFYYDVAIAALSNGTQTSATTVDITNFVPRVGATDDTKPVLYELIATFAGMPDDVAVIDIAGQAGNYLIQANGAALTSIYTFKFLAEMSSATQISFDYIVNAGTSLDVNIVGYEDILI